MQKSFLSLLTVCFIVLTSAQANDVRDCNLAPVVVGCEALQCEAFYLDQDVAGQVCSGTDGNDLKFFFTAATDWDFEHIALWIGESCDDFPKDANGFPDVDSFPYLSYDISGSTEHTVCIALEELEFICEEENQTQQFCVIAFIDMNTPDGNSVGIWVGDKEIANVGGGGGGGEDEPPYSGCISWDEGDGGITGLTADGNINDWLNTGTYLCWEITYNNDGTWTYRYTLDVNSPKNISHLIIEVSESFEDYNYFNGSGPDPNLDDYSSTSQGNSNPGMPCSMFGLKWNPTGESDHFEITFDSNRAPTWGDFYAVDGKKPANEQKGTPSEIPAIWNVGFCDADTPSETENGEWDHIVVPDTNTVPEVEPNEVAYAFCVEIKCECEGHIDCSEIQVEEDPNDRLEHWRDPNTIWSPNIPVDNPYSYINSDPNVIPTDCVIYDSNWLEFLEVCCCDVSTYSAYQSSNTPSLALLRGGLVDDGGDVCRVAFIVWEEGGIPVITPWTDAIYETGDSFSFLLDNLEPDTTYYYQALGKNSVSLAAGSLKYFTTPSF